MKVLVLFESAYGNTCRIAEAIGSGFAESDDVRVEPVADVDPTSLAADLIVVGGPTHIHGLASPTSWRAAVDAAGKDPTLTLDAAACGAHLREWLSALPRGNGHAAAFDTRLDVPVPLTGHASATIARRMKRRGYHQAVEPASFLVDHESTLIDGEPERARRWAEALSAKVHSTDNGGVHVTEPAKVLADS